MATVDTSNQPILSPVQRRALELRRQLVAKLHLFTPEGLAAIVWPGPALRQASEDAVRSGTVTVRVPSEGVGARAVTLGSLRPRRTITLDELLLAMKN